MIARMKYIVSSLLVAVVAIGFASCEHKDLCYHHPHTIKLKVQYDWQYAPDADTEGMCIFFYPVNGGSYYRFDFNEFGTEQETGRSKPIGGEIEIPAGEYYVITYNNNTEGVQFGGITEYGTHEAYTRNGDLFEPVTSVSTSFIPRAEGTEDERTVITPDMMWGASPKEVITVPEHGSSYIHEVIDSSMDGPLLTIEAEEEVVFTFSPREMVCTYTYEIINVANIDQLTKCCASLSGMAGSMNMGTGDLGEESVTLPLIATPYKNENKIEGAFYTFGHNEANPDPHRMILYVWLKDGQKYYYGGTGDKFNVTSQIHNAPNKRRVHIIIDGLDLPNPIQNGEGFVPSVDDWGDGGTSVLPV